jgi:membrane AbrB-like protein
MAMTIQSGLFRSLPMAAQWAALALGSLAFGVLLHLAQVPAALFLGPMLVAIAFGLMGASVRVPRVGFAVAQALIGLMVARAITLETLRTVLADWPVMLAAVAATVLASALVGYLFVRFEVLPGTTAAWGSSPGAASAMVAMAEEFGADPRLVAFMQYLRMVMVALAAAGIAALFQSGEGTANVALAPAGFDPLALAIQLGLIALICVVGLWLTNLLHIPAGALLVPMGLGVAINASGLTTIVLPDWLLVLGYAAIGWSVGLRFDRTVTQAAVTALPRMLVGLTALIVLCGAMSAVLAMIVGADFLTAYLAMSPGGLDTVAIIAAGSKVDITFVLALQTLRLVLIIITGPAMARLIARAAGRPHASRA